MITLKKFSPKGMTLIQEGVIPFQEIYDASMEYYNHPDFLDFNYQIFIYKNIEDFTMNASDVLKLAEADTKASIQNPNINVAIVSDSELVYGVGRMYESYSYDCRWNTRTFYLLEDALSWLDLDAQELGLD